MSDEPYLLIIEDEPDIQALLGELLDRQGIPYRLADDGAGALALASEQWSPVALLDLTLPGDLDGWQVWDRLREMAAGRPLQIVLFTAVHDSRGEQEAQKRGAYAIARKPVRPRELLAVVKRALEEYGSHDNPGR